MKKLVLFFSLILIIQSSALRSQTIDVNLSGRISGEFTMPTSNYYPLSQVYGAYIYIEDLVSNPNDNSLTINLNLNTTQINDTLNLFICLYEYSSPLIDSSNFVLSYASDSFYVFNYSLENIFNKDGISITSIPKNDIPNVSIEITLSNQHFNLGDQAILDLIINTNIPRGNVVWMPLQLGNVWEYNEYIADEGIYSNFQYKIIDSLDNNSNISYVIEKWRLNEMVWNEIAQDTIKTDLLNNLVDQNNEYYIYPYFYLWQWDRVAYSESLSKVAYLTEFSFNLTGLEIDGIAAADVGILNYYQANTGFPPTYHITLNGAKVNGVIVYGTITDIVENLIIQPKEFFLQQNYPNPFNPSTKISWQAPVSGWQTLKVYDVLGNEVATLVDEYRNAGSYEVEFKSSVGSRQLANGVYFYQLKAGKYFETKKMILLK